MKLFTLGPVELHPDTLRIASEPLPYFRTEEFSQYMLKLEQALKTAAGAGKSFRALLLTMSGTGAMEAAVANLLGKKDKALVIDGGTFGHRFVELCQLYAVPHEVLKLEFGQTLTQERLFEYSGKGITALLVNLDETSTGQLYNKQILKAFCAENHARLIVDAISAFLADPIHMEDDGFDAMIISSQKALALQPGLSAILVSEEYLDEARENSRPIPMYMNLHDALQNAKRGQTPYTPALSQIFQLGERLQRIQEQGGPEALIEHTVSLAKQFRKGIAKNSMFSIPNYPLSNALTPLLCNHGNAKALFETLRKEKQICLTPNGGSLADKVVRVGHIGNLTAKDIEMLLDALSSL